MPDLWPTYLAFEAIGQRLADLAGDRARVIRFEGPVEDALRDAEQQLAGEQAAVVFGFGEEVPELFSGAGVSLQEVLPVEFAVIVKAPSRDKMASAIRRLDDLMDDVSRRIITGDTSRWDYYRDGFIGVRDGALRRLDIDPDAYARLVRKEFRLRRDYTES